eukprot:12865507-Alexandrium_andersonii.AAC.1
MRAQTSATAQQKRSIVNMTLLAYMQSFPVLGLTGWLSGQLTLLNPLDPGSNPACGQPKDVCGQLKDVRGLLQDRCGQNANTCGQE